MRKLFTPMTMDVLRIMLYEQPALSPLVGISFIVLLNYLNMPYIWIICSDICCMQISGLITWWLFIFKQMFHWKVVFIGWCNAHFYDNIKNYGQQKFFFQHWKSVLCNISAVILCWTTRPPKMTYTNIYLFCVLHTYYCASFTRECHGTAALQAQTTSIYDVIGHR
jgi:energy-coupling factor transporter transmembrane protein EcfT